MTNEPTTGEIVRALRCDGDANNCVDCRYATYDTATILCDQEQNVREAADRLESQEAQIKQLAEALEYANEWHKESVENATNELRELSGIAGELEKFKAFHERYAEQTSKKYVEDICALTASAESAEAREAAAIADMQDNCQYCVGYEREADEPPCSTCYNARTFEPNDVERTKNWKWRGLQPQDGGGK